MNEIPETPSVLKQSAVRLMLLSGWAVVLLIVVAMVSSSLWYVLFVPERDLPTPLKEWTGICIGFSVGSLFSLVSAFLKPEDR